MQLIRPTPTNAPRQARSASPSSERRTPGTAAINLVSFLIWPGGAKALISQSILWVFGLDEQRVPELSPGAASLTLKAYDNALSQRRPRANPEFHSLAVDRK
jgi:hypothetical protein